MAYLSRIVTPGTGSVYTITIPYLERTHITCFVNGSARTFVWDTDTQITLNGFAPGGGDTVEIIRNTPDNLVQFQDGSTLDEILLNVFDLVHQYQNEEFLEDVRTEELDMGSNKIVNVTDPTLAQDAATKAYVDANSVTDQAYADSVAGLWTKDAGGSKITNVAGPVLSLDAANKAYVDGRDATTSAADRAYTDSVAGLWDFDAKTNRIINVVDPVALSDAATLQWVNNETVANNAYATARALEGGVPGVSQSFHAIANATQQITNTFPDATVLWQIPTFDVGSSLAAGLFTPNKSGTYLLNAFISNSVLIDAGAIYRFRIVDQLDFVWAEFQRFGSDTTATGRPHHLTAVVQATFGDVFRVIGSRVAGIGAWTVTGKFSGSFLHG